MPVGKNARFRFVGSGRNRRRLAFVGGKAVEVTPWPEGGKKGKTRRLKFNQR